MTSEQKGVDGGPAFPIQEERWADPLKPALGTVNYDGMTLRDYFAAKAMQGMAAGPHWNDAFDEAPLRAEAAQTAYAMADAMLAARVAKP